MSSLPTFLLCAAALLLAVSAFPSEKRFGAPHKGLAPPPPGKTLVPRSAAPSKDLEGSESAYYGGGWGGWGGYGGWGYGGGWGGYGGYGGYGGWGGYPYSYSYWGSPWGYGYGSPGYYGGYGWDWDWWW